MNENLIIARYEGPPVGTNGYLIGDADSGLAAMIDAPHGAAAALVAEAQRRGLRIVTLICTHGHFDHIADNRAVLDATGAQLLCHPLEERRLRSPQTMFRLPFEIPPTAPTRLIDEGDTVVIGSRTFTVWHTPGHSEGGICLYCPEASLVITGDTLFDGTFGRTDFSGGDEAAMLASLRRLAALPPETTLLPGHGDASAIGRQQAWIERL